MSKLISEDDYGINELIHICFKAAQKRGFTNPSFSEMTALLHSEISEAYEEYRMPDSSPVRIYYKEGKPEGIPIEFADLAIRLFHYCGYLGIDLSAAIKEKLAYNETRPYRHGNKKS